MSSTPVRGRGTLTGSRRVATTTGGDEPDLGPGMANASRLKRVGGLQLGHHVAKDVEVALAVLLPLGPDPEAVHLTEPLCL